MVNMNTEYSRGGTGKSSFQKGVLSKKGKKIKLKKSKDLQQIPKLGELTRFPLGNAYQYARTAQPRQALLNTSAINQRHPAGAPRRQTLIKNSNKKAPQRHQNFFFPNKQSAVQESGAGRQLKPRKTHTTLVQNARLYQLSQPKYRIIPQSYQLPPKQAAPQWTYRPRPTSQPLKSVTRQSVPSSANNFEKYRGPKRTRKPSPKKHQRDIVIQPQENGRPLLTVNLPAVNYLSESPSPTYVYYKGDSQPAASDHKLDETNTPKSPSPVEDSELSPVSRSAGSIFKAYVNGAWRHNQSDKHSKADKPTTNMSGKEKGSQYSTSPEDFSDGNDSLSAPSEFLAEFLSAIMQRKYVNALKYCKLILEYEPNNITAKEFYPLLEEKLKTAEKEEGSSGAELPSAEAQPTDASGYSNQNTDEKGEASIDEGSSYNSDDSYVLDDELEDEGDELPEEEALGVNMDTPSSRSSGRQPTDSDRSLPSSAGGENDAYNWNNASGSGYEDEDSSKYEDDDNGNAVSVPRYQRSAANNTSTSATGTRFDNQNDDNSNASPTPAAAASTASNENYRKNEEEMRRSKIQQLRSQYVHTVN